MQIGMEVKKMLKYTVLFAVAGMLVMGAPSKSTFVGGSWQVDTRHSDAKLITDATTDYGKTKINVALGYARIRGVFQIDDADSAKSSVEFGNRWIDDQFR